MIMKRISELEGFEEFTNYSICSDGKVYSHKTEKALAIWENSDGYVIYHLSNGRNESIYPKAHRLVALAFLESIPNMNYVNHIDGNKMNNHYKNLEWTNYEGNRVHAIENGLINSIDYGIAQYDLDGNLLNVFHTAADAQKFLGKPVNGGNIGRVIRGKRKTAYGYVWKQAEGYDPQKYVEETINKESI